MYKFRITFSTDINQHYTFDGDDTTVSMTVDAETLREAEKIAEFRLKQLMLDPTPFEMASVQNLTVMASEEERKRDAY